MNAISHTFNQTMQRVRGWLTPEQWAKAETVGQVIWSVARHSLFFIAIMLFTLVAQFTGVASLVIYMRDVHFGNPNLNIAFGYAFFTITSVLAVAFCVVWWIVKQAWGDDQARDDEEP